MKRFSPFLFKTAERILCVPSSSVVKNEAGPISIMTVKRKSEDAHDGFLHSAMFKTARLDAHVMASGCAMLPSSAEEQYMLEQQKHMYLSQVASQTPELPADQMHTPQTQDHMDYHVHGVASHRFISSFVSY